MKTRNLSLLALSGLALQPALAQEKPNVVLIYGDDIGYGDFGCNGSNTINTPNIDAVAAAGIRFTNAHSVAATSTPSRYSLLTGEYAWRRPGTGIASGDAPMIIKPGTFTLAEMFQQAGYTTGAVGKWHLGLGEQGQQDWNGFMTPGLANIGFDYSFIMAATSDRVPCVYLENQRIVNLDPADPIEISYSQNFPGEPTGKDNPELLKMKYSHGHDNSIVNGISRIGYMRGGKSALWVDEEIADRITEKAVEFISTNKDEPFFLYFGTNDIHVPRSPNERFVGKSGMGPRGDAILGFDWTVGQVIQALEEAGIRDNTIVIISSDNGPVVDDGYQDDAVKLLGNHKPWGQFRGGKYSAFEAGTRVPFIVNWPAQMKEPLVSDALVSQVDMLGSFAGMLNVAIPEGAAIDSWNELDTWLGKDLEGREYVVEQNSNNTLSLLMGDWKYIVPSDAAAKNTQKNIEMGNSKEPQIYNLKLDPGEQTNRATRNPEILSQFVEKLKTIRLYGYEIDNLDIVNITGGYDSSHNGAGTVIEKSFDDDLNSYYHSEWNNNANEKPGYFPVTLEYYFAPSDISCIVYQTRIDDNTNGNFKEFEIWAQPDGSADYIKIGDYDLKGAAGTHLIDFTDEQKDKAKNVKAIRFIVKSGMGIRVGYASCAEMIFYKTTSSVGLNAFVEDDASLPIVVRNRKIELREPCEHCRLSVYTDAGVKVAPGFALSPGVYIVALDDRTMKVLIN